MYEPWTNLYVAVEYFWGRQVQFSGQSGQDHRLNLVFRYMFNRCRCRNLWNSSVVFDLIPNEFAIGGVYLPPLLVCSVLGLLLATVTARLLNKYRLSRYFFYPPLVFVAFAVIYTVLIGTFIIRAYVWATTRSERRI